MQFEEHIFISAPVNRIFALYAQVSEWSSWDPDVTASSVEGTFVSGANGMLWPTKGTRTKITFTEVILNRSFTVQSKLPLCTIRFEHELFGGSDQTKVIHRVVFDGPLAFVFGRLIGYQIHKGLPGALQGLKYLTEVQCHQVSSNC